MKRVLAICFLFFALWCAPNASAANPISLDEYRRAVEQSLALVQQADALAQNQRAHLLNQAVAFLEQIDAVQLPSGASASVNNAALVKIIRDEKQTANAVARLTALHDALSQPLATVNTNDLATLQNILSRPPFAEESSAQPDWLQTLLRRIAEILDRMVSNTVRGIFDVRDVIVLVGVLVVIGVLIYFVRNLRRNMVQEQALASLSQAHTARTPTEAFNNAQQFVNQGDYRNAVRQLYLATLLLLDQRGKIKYDPTLTNREYLQQTANDPQTTAALVPIVETFDRTWYGFENITREEFETYSARVQEVRKT